MKWRQPADPQVIDAIIAVFRESVEESEYRLALLAPGYWARSRYWLDASGLALYFCHRLESLGIESAIPSALLHSLRINLEQNRLRITGMFAEFAALNCAFKDAGVEFANLKGFTVSPESCPDPVLRRALDFDFLVDGNHLELCKEILVARGYFLTAATGKTWEFKGGPSHCLDMKDFYKPSPHRSVELHFAARSISSLIPPKPIRDPRLDHLVLRSWGGFVFPSLPPAEQFVSQALHIFGHLCSSCTRPAWLLEYSNHVAFHREDPCFWESVKENSASHRDATIAIGLCSILSKRLFAARIPPCLDEWTTNRLAPGIALWSDRYGEQSVLADFPGTKLYLLLLAQLRAGEEATQMRRQRRRLLIPAPRVPRIVHAEPADTLRMRFSKELRQACFVLFRLRFHLVEGMRYLIEAFRWKRHLRSLQRAQDKRQSVPPPNASCAEDLIS